MTSGARVSWCAGLALFGVAVLLHQGFCVSKFSFPVASELKNTAASYVLATYPPSIEVARQDLGGGRSTVTYDTPPRPIRYAGLEEFFRLNPDCCEVVDRGAEGYTPDLLSRLLGVESHIVRVRYLVRFVDERGSVRSQPSVEHVSLNRRGEVFTP